MTVYVIISSVLLIIGIALVMGLTPERITDDLMQLISPDESIRSKAENTRKGRDIRKTYKRLQNLKNALITMNKGATFAWIMTASVVLLAVGVIFSMAIDNLFLAPVLAIVGIIIPFIYGDYLVTQYKKLIDESLETALSIISISYIRSEDIVFSVQDNLNIIKPPLREMFSDFVTETTLIDSNVKRALYHLKDRLDAKIAKEWCDTVIRCQDDRTLKDTLLPIVDKFSDVRVVNEELTTILSESKTDYWGLVALTIGVIPLLYFLNIEWYNTLIYTTIGKIMLAISALTILITFLFYRQFTKPIEYKI